jgi:hypothetical protein
VLLAAVALCVMSAGIVPSLAASGGGARAKPCGRGSCSGRASAACVRQLSRLRRGGRREADVAGSVAGAGQPGKVGHTPDSRTALVVAPFAYQPYFGESGFAPAVRALEREGYSVRILQTKTLSDVPQVTIDKFIAATRRAGVIVYFGHAAEGLLPLETYRSHGEFLRRARDLLNLTNWDQRGYVKQGIVDNESNLINDKSFPKQAWVIGLTTKGIADLVNLDKHPFVWLTGCHSASLRGGFQLAGAREVFGYEPNILINGQGATDLRRVWNELDGPEDVKPGSALMTTRLTNNAYADCQANDGCKNSELWSGGGPMTLAPAVASIEPNPVEIPSVQPNKTFEIKVGFDTHMDPSEAAADVLTVKGCGVKPAPGSILDWSGDHTIGGRFLVTQTGELTITVHADRAISADGRIELAGNQSGATGLRGGIPRADDFVWQEPCAGLNVRGLDPNLACSKIAAGCVHGPPSPGICGIPSSWSQFEVSGTGLIPNRTYDLTLGGSAHGITENKPIGPIVTDRAGTPARRVFTLPFMPAHDPWTLTATPVGRGSVVTTTLETGVIDCVVMSAGGGGFRSAIAAVGLAPNTPFKEIVDGTAGPALQADADGTVPATEVDGPCLPGPVSVQLSGHWIDHGVFTDDATAAVRQFC